MTNDPYLYSVTNHVATFSVNDAPFNLMPVSYIDRLEEQLPEVLTAAQQAALDAVVNSRLVIDL